MVRVAACQYAVPADAEEAQAVAEAAVRQAAAAGADVLLLPELFGSPYFPIAQDAANFARARPAGGNATIQRFRELARAEGLVLPVSFFEQAGNDFYNSVCMIDADGEVLGLYRKSHLPDGPGYQEKFYFSPGDTGFKVFATRAGRIGVGIYWDQWFPEAARAMVLQGAELLLYPTAIGSEPQDPALDSREHWQRVLQGHAAANLVPVVAANRIGREVSPADKGVAITFYGSSLIINEEGGLAGRCRVFAGEEERRRQLPDYDSSDSEEDELAVEPQDEGIELIWHDFDTHKIAAKRHSWGVFRDRRPDLYRGLAGRSMAPG